MARKLKGVILGLRDVVVTEGGTFATPTSLEVSLLVRFLLRRGLTPVVLANNNWSYSENNVTKPLQPLLTTFWGEFPWYVALRDGTPPKPRAEAVGHVLSKHGWDPSEVVYVGNSEDDMRTAVNGGVLFLNANWYGQKTDYGFHFDTPREIARFIDTFCIREHHWHFAIEKGNLRFYALAPFSTYFAEYASYSEDARASAKQFGWGHPDFWNRYLFATLYFTELYKEFQYIACYPGHRVGSSNPVMEEPLQRFAKCFRKKLLPDLIVRHTDATKSATARSSGGSVGPLNQLNTIHLRRAPLKGASERYKSPPLSTGKTVLVVDDICTEGNSLEAARAYIEKTGAKVIGLSWLKTINRAYGEFGGTLDIKPYEPNILKVSSKILQHSYSGIVADSEAKTELQKKLDEYDKWDWPKELSK